MNNAFKKYSFTFLFLIFFNTQSKNNIKVPEIEQPKQIIFTPKEIKVSKDTFKKNNIKSIRKQITFYSERFKGRKTASGEIFSTDSFTAASRVYPIGTKLLLSKGDINCIVRINDRTGRSNPLVLDVAKAVAKRLCMTDSGKFYVQITQLKY